MVRILAGVAIVIAIFGALLFYNYLHQTPGPHNVPITSPLDSSSSASLADRVDSLEEAVTLLDKKVSQISGTPQVLPSPGTTDLSSRVSILETEVNDLKGNSTTNSGTPTSSTTSSSNTKTGPTYIPLGSSDPIGTTNWTNLDSITANINPADYPGFTSMQLVISLRLNAGGTAYAQLINTANQSAVSNSLVSTTSTNFVLLTSGGFTLPSGNNQYEVQAKDSSGDTMFIQNARIKVNF